MNQADVVGNIKDTAHQGAKIAEKGAQSMVSSTLAFGRNVGDFVSILRGLGVGDVLGAVGLAKKPNMATQVGAIGAGVTVGMGLGFGMGILFAPRPGSETRAMLQKAARGLLGLGDKHDEIQDAKPEAEIKVEAKPGDKHPAGREAPLHAIKADHDSH